MFGYIQPLKPELKIREYESFRSIYCGVCRSMAERKLQLPRFTLSNDAVFLALVLCCAYGFKPETRALRCGVHPLRKRSCAGRNAAIDYAADVNVILAWFKARDDLADGSRATGLAGTLLLGRAFSKVKRRWGKDLMVAARISRISADLQALKQDEATGCTGIDQAADHFARLTRCLFEWHPDGSAGWEEEPVYRSLGWMGYNIGKWIYLADAWKDLETDLKTGGYNPLAYALKPTEAGHPAPGTEAKRLTRAIKDEMRPRIGFLMTACLEQASSALALLPSGDLTPILENIIYLGLRRKMEDMLDEKSV
ncbi:MAG TPA: hypothetical protein DD727_01830 [Clostridiales bacterium]|nr:hypothetical protein [Clostridiales bacterium]